MKARVQLRSETGCFPAQHAGREAIFHPSYSSGTAGIRGTEILSEGQHFWEIKMTTPVYGTDMMIGVCTRDAKLTHLRNQFASLLGKAVLVLETDLFTLHILCRKLHI